MSLGRSLRRLGDRRSARRVPVERVFMHAAGVEGSIAPAEAIKLVCLDVSESGCRALCVGRRLRVGDVARIVFAPTIASDDGIRSRVVRVSALAGGRSEVGFVFERLAPTQRARLVEWQGWWQQRGELAATRGQEALRAQAREDERIARLNEAIRAARAGRASLEADPS